MPNQDWSHITVEQAREMARLNNEFQHFIQKSVGPDTCPYEKLLTKENIAKAMKRMRFRSHEDRELFRIFLKKSQR